MKVVSWNAYAFNPKIENIFSLIESINADVYCFQEISVKMLSELHKRYNECYFQVATDFFEQGQEYFLVIMSRLPFQYSENKSLPRRNKQTPVQFIMQWIEALSFQQVEVQLNNEKYLISNIHLSNGDSPSRRISEMSIILDSLKSRYSTGEIVLCGDMNAFAMPILNTFISLFFNYKPNEIFTDESQTFVGYLKDKGFVDALPKVFTQNLLLLKFKLDYIFVSDKTKVINADVVHKKFGSDHKPVYLEI
jgi:exonuclease III